MTRPVFGQPVYSPPPPTCPRCHHVYSDGLCSRCLTALSYMLDDDERGLTVGESMKLRGPVQFPVRQP